MGYNQFGDKNPRWKGGTSEGYKIRIYEGILKQNGVDLKICQVCKINKKDTKRMCVHHIDGNHSNNNFDNLIRLCTKCHLKIHLSKIKYIKVCLFCKKEFYIIPSKLKTRKFCSQNCSNRYYNERRKGINDHRFKECINCGKTFSFPPSRDKRGRCEFCSQKCHYEHRKKDKNAMSEWNKVMLAKRMAKNKT